MADVSNEVAARAHWILNSSMRGMGRAVRNDADQIAKAGAELIELLGRDDVPITEVERRAKVQLGRLKA